MTLALGLGSEWQAVARRGGDDTVGGDWKKSKEIATGGWKDSDLCYVTLE